MDGSVRKKEGDGKKLDFSQAWVRTAPSKHEQQSRETEEPHASDEVVIDEEDDEALPPSTTQSSRPLIFYDIIHSPSYQVPVLYVTFKDLPLITRSLPPPEQVYEMLVPPSYRQQVSGVGPMGALSTTDHPMTSTPAYFVHPCRTAEAMDAVTGGRDVEPAEYLLQWIGVIGQSVGLSVPLQLAHSPIPRDRAGQDT